MDKLCEIEAYLIDKNNEVLSTSNFSNPDSVNSNLLIKYFELAARKQVILNIFYYKNYYFIKGLHPIHTHAVHNDGNLYPDNSYSGYLTPPGYELHWL